MTTQVNVTETSGTVVAVTASDVGPTGAVGPTGETGPTGEVSASQLTTAVAAEETARIAADDAALVDANAAYVKAVDLSIIEAGSGGSNVTVNPDVNTIDGATGNTISGGGTAAFPNTIDDGGSTIVNTIGGGYDNAITATGVGANTMAGGAHHVISGAGSHGSILGGSYQSITGGDYPTIGGGTLNSSSASYTTLGGGVSNDITAKESTIAGGNNNTVTATGTDGRHTIGGGASNAISGTGNADTISGGQGNEATDGDYGTIGGGVNNTTSADKATVSGGSNNSASADAATVVGGSACTATALYAVSGGLNADATGTAAVALGREVAASGSAAVALNRDTVATAADSTALGRGSKAYHAGMISSSSAMELVAGDRQTSRITLKETTTDASTSSMDGPFSPQDSSTFAYRVTVVARETATGDSKALTLSGVARRSGSTVTLIGGSPTAVVLGEDAGASAWTASLLAGSGTFNVRVTGEAAHTIEWLASVELTEVVS